MELVHQLFRAFFLLLKGKLKLEGCTRCTRFSIGFEIGPKEGSVARIGTCTPTVPLYLEVFSYYSKEISNLRGVQGVQDFQLNLT